mgnify:CR=1 FL=1
MYTYFLMGLPFIAFVLILDLFILRTRVVTKKPCWIVMAIMLLITAFFDQFLTGLPIVHYNEANMSGIRLLYAPIEDFMYTIAAVIGLGSLLAYYEKRSS